MRRPSASTSAGQDRFSQCLCFAHVWHVSSKKDAKLRKAQDSSMRATKSVFAKGTFVEKDKLPYERKVVKCMLTFFCKEKTESMTLLKGFPDKRNKNEILIETEMGREPKYLPF